MPTAHLTPAFDSLVGFIGSERSIALPRVTQLQKGKVRLQVLDLLDPTSSALSRRYCVRCDKWGGDRL